jgi:hypothetical protein
MGHGGKGRPAGRLDRSSRGGRSSGSLASRAALLGLGTLGAVWSSACGRDPTAQEQGLASARSRISIAVPASPDGHEEGTCVALVNGDVLALGGRASSAITASVDRFDHVTRTWSAVKPLARPLYQVAGVRLADGRLLFLGGRDAAGTVADVSIYDAAGATRTSVAPLPAAATGLALVALADGRAVALGGTANVSLVYDPAKDAWKALPAIPALSTGTHATHAARLTDGRVLVIAGDPLAADTKAALLDAKSESWTPTSIPKHLDDGAKLVALPGNGALFVGGGTSDAPVADAELFDAATGAWAAAPPMPHGHARAGVAEPVSGGLIAFYGGEHSAAVDLFDPAQRAWRTAGYALAARTEGVCATRVSDHELLLGPGYAKFNGYSAGTDAELLSAGLADAACTLSTECWSGVCDPRTGRCGAIAPAVDAGPAVADAGSAPAVVGAFTRCTKGAECATGHCVDGVCCDVACDQACFSCVLPSAPGKCSPEPAGVDLRGECGVQGGCTGTCNGAGRCVDATAGSQCRGARCVSATTGVGPAECRVSGGLCDLESVTPFDCAPYACAPALGACLTQCVSTDDCAGGYGCQDDKCALPDAGAKPADCGTGPAPARGVLAATLAMAALGLATRWRRRARRPRGR